MSKSTTPQMDVKFALEKRLDWTGEAQGKRAEIM
jgi:hypothetical protein